MTRAELGAWLLRCNPDRTDLAVRFAAPTQQWCVTDNYRSRLMRPADEVLLWISGSRPRYARGIWGRGRVLAPAQPSDHGWRIQLALELAPAPLATDAELRAAGVDDLEVQRVPQGSNPSWVSRARFATIVSAAS